MPSILALGSALSIVPLAAAIPHSTPSTVNHTLPNFNSPPPLNLSLLANGSLYYQWRPKARFNHPSDHLGDPTALWQDDNGTFRISALLSNFRTPNVSLTSGIAGATTDDFLTFTDYHNYSNNVEIGPGNKNDMMAVFDGSVIPKGYKGLPTLIFTGANYAPITWSKFYIKGAERQNLAYSEDDGATWILPDIDPVIPEAPNGNNVTGFRDAWVFQYPQIASLLGDVPETWYLTVSGGIHGVGPRVFLYRCNSEDFLDWEFLGVDLEKPVNTTTSLGGFSGGDGSNYECANTIALDHHGENLTHGISFMTVGAESGRDNHSSHWSMWKVGEFAKNNESGVTFQDHATGIVDWGVGYACSTVPDEKTDRRLMLCWTNEDFNTTNEPDFQIGQAGALTLPRELFVKEIENVVADGNAAEPGSWAVITEGLKTVNAAEGVRKAQSSGNKTVNLAALGVRPAKEVLKYRDHAEHIWNQQDTGLSPTALNGTGAHISNNGNVTNAFIPFWQSPQSRHWELQATVEIPSQALRNGDYSDFAAGFTLLRNNVAQPADWPTENATIYYRPSNESFFVTRDVALNSDFVNPQPEIGKLRLFEINDNNSTSYEKLHIRAFLDGSLFEVYVNDLLTISTRIYYWYEDSTDMGFYLQWPSSWSSDNTPESTTVTFSNITVWEGLPNVFPYRPSSTELLIQNRTGFVEPVPNFNADTMVYDGVGPPPLPDAENIPAGLSDEQIASID